VIHSDLAALEQSLTSDDLLVVRNKADYFFESTTLASLQSAEEVRSKAEELVALLSGAVALSLESRTPIRVGNVAQVSDSGQRNEFVSVADTVTVRSSVSVAKVSADGTVETRHPADLVTKWIKATESDTNVAKVLRLLGDSSHDWVSLYRLLEVVEADVGGLDGISDQGWATKTALRGFKHTANSPGAVGDSARHGTENTQPPARPMDLAEARSLINFIVHNWLCAKP
jgi:hypothetical protein